MCGTLEWPLSEFEDLLVRLGFGFGKKGALLEEEEEEGDSLKVAVIGMEGDKVRREKRSGEFKREEDG